MSDDIPDIADFAIEKYEFPSGTTLSDEAREGVGGEGPRRNPAPERA